MSTHPATSEVEQYGHDVRSRGSIWTFHFSIAPFLPPILPLQVLREGRCAGERGPATGSLNCGVQALDDAWKLGRSMLLHANCFIPRLKASRHNALAFFFLCLYLGPNKKKPTAAQRFGSEPITPYPMNQPLRYLTLHSRALSCLMACHRIWSSLQRSSESCNQMLCNCS
jgi:hypothetical protein